MNRSQLSQAISERTDLAHGQVEQVLDAFEQVLIDAVANKDEVKLPGLLTLDVTERSARTGRNPQTGESMEIPAASVPRLRAGAKLKRAAQG